METMQQQKLTWPQLAGLLAVALLIFGGVILLITLRVRDEIRSQMVGRDGEILTAVASMLHTPSVTDLGWSGEEEATDMLETILQTSHLRGVLGVQIFESTGAYLGSVPFGLEEERLTPDELDRLQRLEPISRYLPQADLGDLFGLPASGRSSPVLEVAVPIHQRGEEQLDGIARYIMDGGEIASEFAALDRHLALQGGLAFAIGAGLLTALAAASFSRLRHTHSMLVQSSQELLQANRELLLLAKTSAVGALTSHLIHGLKNPLAGLDEHLKSFAEGSGESRDWVEAAEAARRMRELINDVVGILRDHGDGAAYHLSVTEIGQMVEKKIAPAAAAAGVVFSPLVSGEEPVPGRTANLTVLVLVNLLQNALDASSPGQEVTVRSFKRGGQLWFEVADQGPGLPEEQREKLFLPGPSSRRGGTGLGLAISQLLARQMEASLSLKKSDSTGTVFSLQLPRQEPVGQGPSVSSTAGA